MNQNSSELPLVVKNLTKRYVSNNAVTKTITAVKDVSFSLERAEIFGLLGPNGAGKTSLISTIVTLEKPTEGQIYIYGVNNQEAVQKAKCLVGFVPQEIINHGYFNVFEILQFHSGYYGLYKNDERINYLLNELGLYEHRLKKVKQLSGGMKRRLLIAKALVHNPKLLLLDEPTAGVDVELRTQLWAFVKKLKAEGVTILLTTHYLEEAEKLCDRVGLIFRGELKLVSPTTQLIQKYTGRSVRVLCRDRKEPLLFNISHHETVGELLLKNNLKIENIVDLKITEGTLEDAFRQFIDVSEAQ